VSPQRVVRYNTAMAEILVVEDDEDYGELLKTALGLEHHVRWVKDGQMAIDEISVHDFSVVLLDLKIPKVNGLSLYNLMKFKLKMKVVISSGTDNLAQAFPDADGVLQKPYSVTMLKGAIDKALS